MQEYITWNSEKYIFQDEQDLGKILSLDVEYEKHGKEWFSLSTVRAFNSGREFLEYYFTETFPRQISWSFDNYQLPDDMKVSMDTLLGEFQTSYGKQDKNVEKLQNIIVLFKDYMNRGKFSVEELKKFKNEIMRIGLNFGKTKIEIQYVGDYKGLVEIAFENGAHYIDDEDGSVSEIPEVELIRSLIDYE